MLRLSTQVQSLHLILCRVRSFTVFRRRCPHKSPPTMFTVLCDRLMMNLMIWRQIAGRNPISMRIDEQRIEGSALACGALLQLAPAANRAAADVPNADGAIVHRECHASPLRHSITARAVSHPRPDRISGNVNLN